ncbi:hypothetical protein [Actinacidiphila glaucinigra]|uniref:hypothetical protein n=1 Tax=Actinacidiphila glaucinigra TaxID=235986 RepID=UPI003D94C396
MQSYADARLTSARHKNRNVHLYGLPAERLGNQLAVDKALFGSLTAQVPRFTQAHYINAMLGEVLQHLDPRGTDLDQMEIEKDLVYALAEKGQQYREYILSDPDSAVIPEQRPVCKLSAEVNDQFARMIDVMKTMPGQITAKPFEIVSACLSEYLDALGEEREALTALFRQSTITTIQ